MKYLLGNLVHRYCNLDSENYMMAASLRGCLKSLGATGNGTIKYIDIAYGHTDYLDNVCNSVSPNLIFDKSRTESQPDSCPIGSGAFQYPSHCEQGWLGTDCTNGCAYMNYLGFYCKGIS